MSKRKDKHKSDRPENTETGAVTGANPEEAAAPRRHSWKYDLILLLVLALIAVAVFAYYKTRNNRLLESLGEEEPDYYVQVMMNNRIEGLIPIDQDGEYTFRNIYSDGENVVCVENGGCYMLSANCPDQICVYEGVIEPGTIMPIVCMPNVIYVSIVEASEIDYSYVHDGIDIPERLSASYEEYKENH